MSSSERRHSRNKYVIDHGELDGGFRETPLACQGVSHEIESRPLGSSRNGILKRNITSWVNDLNFHDLAFLEVQKESEVLCYITHPTRGVVLSQSFGHPRTS